MKTAVVISANIITNGLINYSDYCYCFYY